MSTALPADAAPATGMFRELLWVHAHLRRDLATVRRLAAQARAGVTPADVAAEVRALAAHSPLWRLKFGCLAYCRLVHTHHTIEDAAVFPMVRRHDPSLARVVDRLEEDHLAVHHLTERIAALAEQVPPDQEDLAAALAGLEALLLDHLATEEAALGPLLAGWDAWPQG